jgi:hypothetical protein
MVLVDAPQPGRALAKVAGLLAMTVVGAAAAAAGLAMALLLMLTTLAG